MSAAALAFVLSTAIAPATVKLCYNYGCKREVQAQFDSSTMNTVIDLFTGADNAQVERIAISLALGVLMRTASVQTPIGADRARNPWYQSDVEGRMDCVDHSINATRLLQLFESRGALKFHRAGERVRRAGVLTALHWTATVRETQSGQSWAVDTWFRDPGAPAVILPLAQWKDGGDDRDVE